MTLKQALEKYRNRACVPFFENENGANYLFKEKSELLNAKVISVTPYKTTCRDINTSSPFAPSTACEDIYIELDREEVYKRFPNKKPIERPRKPLYKIFGKTN